MCFSGRSLFVTPLSFSIRLFSAAGRSQSERVDQTPTNSSTFSCSAGSGYDLLCATGEWSRLCCGGWEWQQRYSFFLSRYILLACYLCFIKMNWFVWLRCPEMTISVLLKRFPCSVSFTQSWRNSQIEQRHISIDCMSRCLFVFSHSLFSSLWFLLYYVTSLENNILPFFLIHPALHLAVMQGRLNNVRALLTESNIDAEAFNLRYLPPNPFWNYLRFCWHT